MYGYKGFILCVEVVVNDEASSQHCQIRIAISVSFQGKQVVHKLLSILSAEEMFYCRFVLISHVLTKTSNNATLYSLTTLQIFQQDILSEKHKDIQMTSLRAALKVSACMVLVLISASGGQVTNLKFV